MFSKGNMDVLLPKLCSVCPAKVVVGTKTGSHDRVRPSTKDIRVDNPNSRQMYLNLTEEGHCKNP